MNAEVDLPRWHSERAQQHFRTLEAMLWHERFPTPPAAQDVATRFGSTRAYHWPGSSDPVVLLHGMGGTSLMWAAAVGDLAAWDVYALDTMGDVGRSVPRAPFTDTADVAAWLDEAFEGLRIDSAHLVGSSYGAWMAMNLALRRPARVRSLSLLDPAGLAPISRRFFTWGAKVFLASALPAPARRRAALRLRMPLLEDRRMMRMAFSAQLHHPFRLPIEILADDDLSRIRVPSLLLIGERSEIYDHADEVVARATAMIPDVEVVMIPEVGHTLPIDPRANAGRRVAEFLSRTCGRA
jgi:pimeloyl-ACP methyl ester carboxylesterase